ncbi:hypothetical protein B0H34DRAFT_736012 [Crassisporium funariophilum]|nr:hypothetical protein B0H34DRAFT_736012 [Crassisporium funariophilum]
MSSHSSNHTYEKYYRNSLDVPRIHEETVMICKSCRSQKMKCDGKRPSCGTCSRLGRPCRYLDVSSTA